MTNSKKVKSDGFLFKILEEVLYIVFVILGFYLAFLIRFDMNPPVRNIEPYFSNIPYMIIASIIIFYIYDIVSTLKKTLLENALIIALSLIVIDIVTIAIAFLNRGFAFPRSVFILGYIIQFLLIFITKLIILKMIKSNIEPEDILIIGSKRELEHISKKILSDKLNKDNIKYLCEDVDKCTYDLAGNVEKIYIGDSVENKDKLDIVKYGYDNNINIYLVPDIFDITLTDIKVNQVDDLLIFKIGSLGLTGEQKLMKRILDLFVSSIGLIIISPVLIIISIIIKLYDRGPIFYKQERVTENNKRFNLYKFRTMIVDAEKYTGPTLATDEDPRITPLGKFLRATRIDELPQLLNVLKGDMSMVGPRPERPFFVDQFNKEVEGFKYRVSVKAGITGLAQVLSNYSTDPETKVKYDLLYIKSYSLLFDIKLIFNTVKTVFMRDQSKGVMEDEEINKKFEELGFKIDDDLDNNDIDKDIMED
ncbi:MAG TPA: sugar transferase [Tissierellaceae bacterium]|nr:sugar transferase [Tissierellaceae bacterium]